MVRFFSKAPWREIPDKKQCPGKDESGKNGGKKCVCEKSENVSILSW
jgi:hypothetical protein